MGMTAWSVQARTWAVSRVLQGVDGVERCAMHRAGPPGVVPSSRASRGADAAVGHADGQPDLGR